MKNTKKIVNMLVCIAMMIVMTSNVFADENADKKISTPVSTAETTPALVEETTPTPTLEATPAPAGETMPTPAVEATPAPTLESTPVPMPAPTPIPTLETVPTNSPLVNNDEITVRVNGTNVVFEDVKPQIIDGRTLVPIRKVGEALNAAVAWRATDNTVHIFRNGMTIMLTMGKAEMAVREYEYGDKFIYTTEAQPNMYIDPENKDVVARTINDRTMIPFRAVCETLGGTVNWDGNQRLITVNIPQYKLTLSDKDAANLIESWNYQPVTELKTGSVDVKVWGNFAGASANLADGVTVTLNGNTQTVTNGEKCSFADVKAGTYTLTVNNIPAGYEIQNAASLSVTVVAGQAVQVTIPLTKVETEKSTASTDTTTQK